MNVSVKVTSAFVHGNKPYAVGDTAEFTKTEAADMAKTGLIEVIGDAEPSANGAKMDDAVQNKMANATANKSTKTK